MPINGLYTLGEASTELARGLANGEYKTARLDTISAA